MIFLIPCLQFAEFSQPRLNTNSHCEFIDSSSLHRLNLTSSYSCPKHLLSRRLHRRLASGTCKASLLHILQHDRFRTAGCPHTGHSRTTHFVNKPCHHPLYPCTCIPSCEARVPLFQSVVLDRLGACMQPDSEVSRDFSFCFLHHRIL